jgi:hypothetical protein
MIYATLTGNIGILHRFHRTNHPYHENIDINNNCSRSD